MDMRPLLNLQATFLPGLELVSFLSFEAFSLGRDLLRFDGLPGGDFGEENTEGIVVFSAHLLHCSFLCLILICNKLSHTKVVFLQ